MNTCTFTIRPLTNRGHSRQALLILATELGLRDTDVVTVAVVGDELRITLTPVGQQLLEDASR